MVGVVREAGQCRGQAVRVAGRLVEHIRVRGRSASWVSAGGGQFAGCRPPGGRTQSGSGSAARRVSAGGGQFGLPATRRRTQSSRSSARRVSVSGGQLGLPATRRFVHASIRGRLRCGSVSLAGSSRCRPPRRVSHGRGTFASRVSVWGWQFGLPATRQRTQSSRSFGEAGQCFGRAVRVAGHPAAHPIVAVGGEVELDSRRQAVRKNAGRTAYS